MALVLIIEDDKGTPETYALALDTVELGVKRRHCDADLRLTLEKENRKR